MQQSKPIIYQLFPRLFTNTCENCIPNGSIEENGVGKMNQIDSKVLNSIKKLGVSHMWYTGVIEHAQATQYTGIEPDNQYVIKGKAGSPYAIKDYYDIDPDIAEDVEHRIDEFKALIARTHEAGMKVIIDFVPNHVARHYNSDAKPAGVVDFGENDNKDHWFNPANNFYYIQEQFAPSINLGEGADRYQEFPAKATGNDCFSAYPSVNDWYETVKLNYGVDYSNHSWHFDPIPTTWHQMLDIIRYWAAMGVDGFRCDMAFMVPVPFWNWMIPQVKETYPELIFIAELYDTNIYHQFLTEGCFDYLYDKVNLYDTLRAVACGYTPAYNLSNCWRTVEGVSNKMLNFLENHDEQRIASPQFAGDAQKGIPALIVSATISNAPFLLYSGQELGEKAEDAEGFSGKDGRTTIFDYWSIPSIRRWYNGGKCDGRKSTAEEKALRKAYSKILNISASEEAIYNGELFDLMYVNHDTMDASKQFAYLRHTEKEVLLIVANFSNEEANINVRIPSHAFSCLNINEGIVNAKELIHSEKAKFELTIDGTLPIKIAANDGVIWKFKKK